MNQPARKRSAVNEPAGGRVGTNRVGGEPASRRPVPVEAASLAGPERLGRSLLIGPDDAVPEPWSGSEVMIASADAEDEPEIIGALRRAWRERRRVVIRWRGPLPDPRPVLDRPFYDLTPDQDIPGDELDFLVSANTVQALDGVTRFAPLARALTLGAEPVDQAGAGDITTPAGGTATPDGPVWVDGGPLDLDLDPGDGGLVIPRVQLLARSLRPVVPGARASADLAPDQLAAVTHRRGPARILAPAGSGKTRVLTERTRHLVRDCGLAPAAVSLVAYNRRAREEMAQRLDDVNGLDIRTLNSFALAIANGTGPFASGTRRASRTIDEMQARRLLSDLIPGRRRRQLNDPLEPWIDGLSACRLGLRHPDEIEAAYGGDLTGFAEVLDRYRAVLADRGEMDFDEQILAAVTRLLTDPEAREVARRAAPLLLIDEFQDLTPAHLLLVRLVVGPAREVFAVGDDDQTIYGYAGASPRWLVEFDRYFPDAVDHRLVVNYRCPPGVVDRAVSLLSHNRHRVVKEITSPRSLSPETAADPESGDDDTGATGDDDTGATGDDDIVVIGGEAQDALVERVQSLLKAGVDADDIAVLSRVHAALLPAAVHLRVAGVPVRRPPGLDRRVLERSGVAAALAWLRLATAPAQALDPDDLALALRRPPRSLHPRVAEWACEQSSVARLEALAGRLNTERESATVAEFAADVARVRAEAESGNTTSVLEMVMHDIGLLGAASQLDSSQRTARRAAHADELAAVMAVAPLEPDPAVFEPWLRSVLADGEDHDSRHDGGLNGDEDGDDGAGDVGQGEAAPGAVTLATIHTTKGLEWPHVIVHNVNGDLFPHRLADDLEEERRVFHVAVTRGRESVALTTSGPPSPFVAQLRTPRPADEPWPDDVDEPTPTTLVVSDGRSGRAGGGPAERAEPGGPAEAARREALTDWRRSRCRADGVPAYVVLDNKTLDAIAAENPGDLARLGRISGIGPVKLERYGSDILGVLSACD